MLRRISPTLVAKAGKICCVRCEHPLCDVGVSWKKSAALSTVPVHELPGASAGLLPTVVLRRIVCPNCLCLLDTETALPEDPFLEDVIAI